jgi:hypothetical protein
VTREVQALQRKAAELVLHRAPGVLARCDQEIAEHEEFGRTDDARTWHDTRDKWSELLHTAEELREELT